jgi:hypothetical protein
VFFTLQGFFGGGGMHTQWPHYLAERFPTEVLATWILPLRHPVPCPFRPRFLTWHEPGNPPIH